MDYTRGSNANQSLVLNYENHLHVEEDVVIGTVDINLALLQEQRIDKVHIKLRGAAVTFIKGNQSSSDTRETVWLVRLDQDLWSRGSAFPEPGSHVLRVPFRFQLPHNLPPSFHYDVLDEARISYSLEVVGRQSGFLPRSRRIGIVFPLVPTASEPEIAAQRSLSNGWAGPWKTLTSGSNIRRGLWGEYSRVDGKICFPDLDFFPIATPIPFRICIVTTTKEMKKSKIIARQSEGKEIFPAPPSDLAKIVLSLDRRVRIEALASANNRYQPGHNLITERTRFVTENPEWFPTSSSRSGDGLGRYRQSISLEFTAVLGHLPSFEMRTIRCEHVLCLKASITKPIGNNIKLEIPISLNSGVAHSMDHDDLDSFSRRMELLFHTSDLPPSYWEGDGHNWDDNEKA